MLTLLISISDQKPRCGVFRLKPWPQTMANISENVNKIRFYLWTCDHYKSISRKMKHDKMKFLRTLEVDWSRGGPSLPSVASLPARSLRWVDISCHQKLYFTVSNKIFVLRSLPLPKLGLKNSCWNAGKILT